MFTGTVRRIAFTSVLVGFLPATVRAQSKLATESSSPHSTILNRYCVTCHNELGADVNAANIRGQTGLHAAAYTGADSARRLGFQFAQRISGRRKEGFRRQPT